MKKSNVALLSALLILSVAGVGTATAYLVTAAHEDSSGHLDQAIVLNWGENKSIANVTNLTPGNPIYQELTVAAPEITTNANVTPTFTATLEQGTGETDAIVGLHVDIATTTWETQEAPTPVIELGVDYSAYTSSDEEAGSFTETVDVSAATTYYIRYTLDQDAYNNLYAPRATDAKTLNGTLTFSLSYTENAVESGD